MSGVRDPSLEVLEVPSRTDQLARIRAWLEDLLGAAPLDRRERARWVLAVDEACANVVEHAHAGDPDLPLRVEVTIARDLVEVVVRDRGPGFDPENLPEEELEESVRERRRGGLGFRLIRTVVDDVTYERARDGNALRLRGRLGRRPESAGSEWARPGRGDLPESDPTIPS